VRRGKKDIYLKDQATLDRFFLEHGVDGLGVRASKGPLLAGEPLLRLAERLRLFRRALSKIDRRADARIVAAVLRSTGLGKNELRDEKRVAGAIPRIQSWIEKRYPDIRPVVITAGLEIEHGSATLSISPRPGSSVRPVTLDWSLVDSAEYEELYSIEQDIRSIGQLHTSPVKLIGRTSRRLRLVSRALTRRRWRSMTLRALDFIDQRGRKGTAIQRLRALAR